MAEEPKMTVVPFYLDGQIRHIPMSDNVDEITFITDKDEMFRKFKRHPEKWGTWQLVEERPATTKELDEVIWRRASFRNSPHAAEN